MKTMRIIIFIVTLTILQAITGYCNEQIELSVLVVADKVPDQITIDEEGTVQSNALMRAETGNAYNIMLSIPRANELVVPYRLVASWGETKEQLYFGLRPVPPKNKKVNINIYHKDSKCDYQALCEIEALGTDYDSVLQRYFRARNYHKVWRFQNNQPEHIVAIRSAKLWFDAAYNLIKLKSIFRMDTEIKDIMDEYEKMAAKNPAFERRYHNCVPRKYVQIINDQIVGMDWVFVENIRGLVAEGELEKAKALNELAINNFSNKPKEIRQLIGSIQGVDSKLLVDNAKFINSLKAQIR